MADRLNIGATALDALSRNPAEVVEGRVNGSAFQARVGIPDYAANVARHYGCVGSLTEIARRTAIPFEFNGFGLICKFDRPVELMLHDREMALDDGIRGLAARYGPVVIHNAAVPARLGAAAQRNIFPNLNFHFDRGANQPTQYSLFTRDPRDPEQVEPRRSSTVFVANIVAHLQLARESGVRPDAIARQTRYDLFQDEPIERAVGRVVLEQRWDAPRGVGEISILYNRNVLHASYYRDKTVRGYPIGVTYLK